MYKWRNNNHLDIGTCRQGEVPQLFKINVTYINEKVPEMSQIFDQYVKNLRSATIIPMIHAFKKKCHNY